MQESDIFASIWRAESRKPERYSSAAPLSRKYKGLLQMQRNSEEYATSFFYVYNLFWIHKHFLVLTSSTSTFYISIITWWYVALLRYSYMYKYHFKCLCIIIWVWMTWKHAYSHISMEHDTADARQRIVSERVDLVDNLILSVSVMFL